MNAKQLLTHFDRLADAPDAIPRLRRFILALAVRGKLVEQDPNDESAAELLKRIAAEKKRLVEVGKIRKSRTEAEVSGALPYDLPSGWACVPFGLVHYLVRGVTYSKSDVADTPMPGYVAILRANNIGSNLSHDEPVFVKRERVSADQFLRSGDFMIALSSGSKNLVGKAAFVPEDFDEAFGGFCGVIRLYARQIQDFVGVYLQSDLYRESISAGSRGIGINNLKKEILSNLIIPLPPLAEQHRIVAKVDELMVLCDRLETERKEREATRDRLTAASLARLNAPDPDPAVFQNHATFALDNLAPLTTRPDQIKALRQTILNLAVRGKLVEQDPEDEPAGELLKRVAAEKARLVETGKIRDTKAAIEALNENFTHQLPLNWSAVTISQIAYLRSGTALKHGEEQDIGNIPYLKVADLSLVENDKGIITSSRFVGWDRKGDVIESGSIVFPKRGGAIATNRKRRTHVNIVCDSNIMAMKPFAHDTLPFLELWFNSFDLWKLNSGTSVPQINNKDIYPLPLLLPPLAEQHRIVAKVDELMVLRDRLEASLAVGGETRGRLVEALLHETLATGRPAI